MTRGNTLFACSSTGHLYNLLAPPINGSYLGDNERPECHCYVRTKVVYTSGANRPPFQALLWVITYIYLHKFVYKWNDGMPAKLCCDARFLRDGLTISDNDRLQLTAFTALFHET